LEACRGCSKRAKGVKERMRGFGGKSGKWEERHSTDNHKESVQVPEGEKEM